MGILRQIAILLVLAGLAAGGYVVYRDQAGVAAQDGRPSGGRGARPAAVEVAAAGRVRLSRSVEAVGTTRALRSVDVVPHAEGRIAEIAIVPGVEVAAGAVLARLDDEVERATLTEAEAALSEKSRALERAQTLIRSNTISQANLEQLRSEHAVAEAAVLRARRRLEDRTVRAPFPGVTGLTSIDLGARVDTDTVLTTLDDLSAVEIEFRLPETVYGQIAAGQDVTATAAAFPDRTFRGRVEAVDSRIDAPSRSFRVRARLPNEDRTLPVGMFMRLELGLAEREGIVVPEEALLVQGPATFLFVAVDGKAQRRRVETGLRRDGRVEIVEGVAEGEAVIVRGVQSVRDGGAVTVVAPPPASSSLGGAPAAARA